MGRGILVDSSGYFVGAYRWPESESAPDFNAVMAGPGRLNPASRLILLTQEEALDPPSSAARWRFSDSVWETPTEARWVVRQRRDIPDFWSLSGKRMIWLERPPVLPEGSKLIDAPPPEGVRSAKPIWDESAGEWLLPRKMACLAEDGTIDNFVTSYRDDDLPPNDGSFIEAGEALEGQDETGRKVPAGPGDQVKRKKNGSTDVKIKQLPRYRQMPVHILEQSLEAAGHIDAFLSFLQGRGISIDHVRRRGEIGFRNKLLRDFIKDQGMTMRQANDTIQTAAEAALAQEEIDQAEIDQEEP